MDQNGLRSSQRRSGELYPVEVRLRQGHRGSGAHVHKSAPWREITVTNFVREENGGLREVKRTLGKER